MAFLGSFLQYFIILIFLVAVAAAGIFTGKKLRDRKDANTAQEAGSDIQNEK